MIYTSRYANPELKSGDYTPVRISLGAPRWKIAYVIAGAIRDLMPVGLIKIESPDEFRSLYYKRLDEIGVERIRLQIEQFERLGKPVVLLCFEDVRNPDFWCHRRVFADWWLEKTGELIEELPDSSPVKSSSASKVSKAKADEPKKKTAIAVTDEKALIRVVYSINPGGIDGDMYYAVDRVTGKQTRLSDKDARSLISEGKADVLPDYDSISKIEFVLSDGVNNRAYRVDSRGRRIEITFKEALQLVLDGKANLNNIIIE